MQMTDVVCWWKKRNVPLYVIVFSAGRKKKLRRNKNAASSSSRSTQSQTATRLNDTELVGQSAKLKTFTSDTGLLLHYLLTYFTCRDMHISHFFDVRV